MERIVIIECGAAQTRAALIIDDVVRQFWFGPARGDTEALSAPEPGRMFCGRVKAIDPTLNAAFVDIGAAAPGFLPLLKKIPRPTVGQLIAVTVKHAPRGEKGAALALTETSEPLTKVGRIGIIDDPVIEAAQSFGSNISTIIIDTGAAKPLLEKQMKSSVDIKHHRAGTSLFAHYEADAALESAFRPVVELLSGGRLIITEATALTAIDVDTGGMDAASPAKLREKINIEAASSAAFEISRRNVGGQIVIDFLNQNRTAQERLNARLKTLFPGAQKAGWTKSGLFAFVLPRIGATLLERYAEETDSEPVAGRQFTIDWVAASAMQELEQHLRSAPSTQLTLTAGAKLTAHLKQKEIWFKNLQDLYGARFNFVADPERQEREFDISG